MIFGVAGTPPNYKGKFRDIFLWLKEMGLNGFEIQCTYGFKISDQNKRIIKNESDKGFFFSMHAPYYIHLGSCKNDGVERSKENFKSGIELAKSLGVERIIFHPGGGHNNTPEGRTIAIKQIINAINNITQEVDMGNVRLYPEIGGKASNLGSLDEIIEICKHSQYCYPCIDIAHLHARENGSIQTKQDLYDKLLKIKQELPDKFEKIHFHAYTINYNDKGEIKHLYHGEDMPDGRVGKPDLNDFVELLKEFNINVPVISEAHDSQELGAKYMRDLYYK